jgi:putative lumazine-binding protein
MMRIWPIFAASALAASTAPAQNAAPADAERDVMAVVNALFDGMRKVDSAMVRPLFHAQARLFAMDLRSEGRPPRFDTLDAFLQAVGRPRTELFDERLSNVMVHIDGTLASVWADYKFYRDTTLSHCGVDHFLLVKDSGRWLIIELADTRRTVNCG